MSAQGMLRRDTKMFPRFGTSLYKARVFTPTVTTSATRRAARISQQLIHAGCEFADHAIRIAWRVTRHVTSHVTRRLPFVTTSFRSLFAVESASIGLIFFALGCNFSGDSSGDRPADASPTSSDASSVPQPDASTSSASCTGLAMQPEDSTWELSSGGRDRFARVHVPRSYDPNTPTPLVLSFHGFTSDQAQQALISGMRSKSDDEGFVVVHPLGVGLVNSWNGGDCCGEAESAGVDDVQFARDLVAEVSRRVCVDPARVYATGFSNGGFLSHRLACEASDLIAAIAPVAGVFSGDYPCTPNRPIPVLDFHGTADVVVPYNGSLLLGFDSVSDTVEHWSNHNNCSASSTVSYDNGDTTCETRDGCDPNGDVTLCTVSLGGHTWPGGFPLPTGKTTYDISATDAMWDFFVAHPL